jgi:hypothetical protein
MGFYTIPEMGADEVEREFASAFAWLVSLVIASVNRRSP